MQLQHYLRVLFAATTLMLTLPSQAQTGNEWATYDRVFENGARQAQWWEAVISLGLLAAATVAVILVAERIYRRALMQTGGKLTYKDAWNAEL